MEDEIHPLDQNVSAIRNLISGLELCHHKAERWVSNIIEAIRLGETGKGLGTRRPGQSHPAEQAWQRACDSLSAWCAGCPAESVAQCVGDRSALKEWQVQRVIEKIRSVIGWPHSAPYVYILFGAGEGESLYRTECPEAYKEHEDFWLATVRTIIHDTENGSAAALSLGLAIDMLWPCHWRFADNLQIVLEAIGGKLKPDTPFAACGRNIALLPIRGRMQMVSGSLRAFSGHSETDREVDQKVLSQLGQTMAAKRWLAASLDKTIRLQLDPPAAVRALSALTAPDWITH